ncbi:Phosphoglycerate dehydrogenase [Cohaesibacter marisflavi]|uniref:Phosphoglycerate dehydrogenase n=1 Tax=Cohaesibacter marisflavi TaxID=655353 RepID=A0A1I5M3X7_9HYPH|nr:2-hydroxyacid dehydrogenase [Cohaesibacter marisflavi]SFP04338.1 Phosphoglycerate dehydrogenase [Cohaesibacter marisflavi]
MAKLSIVFHGRNASTFHDGFEDLLDNKHSITILPDVLSDAEMQSSYEDADVIIGTANSAELPFPKKLRLFQVAGAGSDGVDPSCLPKGATVCNCYGHDQPISEYVMATILNTRIPIIDANARLRQGDWAYQSGRSLHGEISGSVIGLVGYGHISQTIAKCAKVFGMKIYVCNRSPVPCGDLVDHYFPIDDLLGFLSDVDFVVSALPLTDQTSGLLNKEAFEAMKSTAFFCNVGRGPVVDEKALYEALKRGKIANAAIDTWYVYPSADNDSPQPSRYAFNELTNLVMTPHMSGWTQGTIDRRRQAMAENINRLATGAQLENVVNEGG